MNEIRTSRRTLAQAGLWSAPIIASTALIPAYAASSPFEHSVTIEFGLFAQALIEDLDAGYNTKVGVGSGLGASSDPSGQANIDPATGQYLEGASGPAAQAAGTFTPGGSLKGLNSGSYGGVGFFFSSPQTPTGDLVAGSSSLPSETRLRVDYKVSFPEGAEPFPMDSVQDGQSLTIIKQTQGEAVTSSGINSAAMTATYGTQQIQGQDLLLSTSYQTSESITLTSVEGAEIQYGQLLLSQAPAYFLDNPEADFQLTVTVESGAIVLASDQGEKTINLAGQSISLTLPALPVA